MPITAATLLSFAPATRADLIGPLSAALSLVFPAYDITSTARVSQFMGEAFVETDGFRTLREYASGAAYEGREDLGNTIPGDGVKYAGRGIFQYTGRSNYRQLSTQLQYNFLADPDALERPFFAVVSAMLYWQDHVLSDYADAGDGCAIARAINRGNAKASSPANHEAERLAAVERAAAIWSGLSPAPNWSTKTLQSALNKFGNYGLVVDGKAGPKTVKALKAFQASQGLPQTGKADAETWSALDKATA